jgi:hypothetical protein
MSARLTTEAKAASPARSGRRGFRALLAAVVMTAVIAWLPCLAGATTPTLALTGSSLQLGDALSVAPLVTYQSLGQVDDSTERTLQLYGATSQAHVGVGDSLTWTGGFYTSSSYQTRAAEGGSPISPLDISSLGSTLTWFKDPAARNAGTPTLAGGSAYRQLLSQDRMSFQRLGLKSGGLTVSGEYLDVGAQFQGAANLAGQLPSGLDAKAVDAARGIGSLKLSAALQASSNLTISSNLNQVSNRQPGSKQYGTDVRDLTHRLDLTMGGDTSLALVAQDLNQQRDGQTTDTKTTTLGLRHSFGKDRTFGFTDQRVAQSLSGATNDSHTRTFDVAWAFDDHLKAAATMTDAEANGASSSRRDLRVSWADQGTAVSLRRLASSAGGAQTTATTLNVATHLLGGALKFNHLINDSPTGSQVTSALAFEGSYGSMHLALDQVSRSGDGPANTTHVKLTSSLGIAGTPVALDAEYGKGLVNPKTKEVTNPGAALRLVADRPGLNLIADLRQGDAGGFGSRLYLVRDPKEQTGFGPWGDLLLGLASANDMNRSDYEQSLQFGGLKFAVGQRMMARCDGNGKCPAMFTSFDLSHQDLPSWASTLGGGSMFGRNKDYGFATVPGVQSLTGKTGLRVGVSRLTPGAGRGLVQTLDYARVLSEHYLLRLYLGQAAGNAPVKVPERSRLFELCSRHGDKLNWVLRLSSDRTDGEDHASQAFGIRGALSAHETLALTMLRRSVNGVGGQALGLDYARHINDEHYFTVTTQYGAGPAGAGYRIDVAYQKPW